MQQINNTNKCAFDNSNTVEEALKTKLQEETDDIYLRKIKNKSTRYLGITTKDMINHLLDRYGKIKSTALTNNMHGFNNALIIPQPIDVDFMKMDECIQFATDSKTSFTTSQVLTAAAYTVQWTCMF
eukprot:15366337-Ditylum_brightwellii.AAC.1